MILLLSLLMNLAQANSINIPGDSFNWKNYVATVSALPALNNVLGDTRITLDTLNIYAWNGSAWVQINGSSGGGGITTLNGLTTASQSFAVGTGGSSFNISSAGSIHTFNLPTASSSVTGALSSTDWTTFNGKQSALTFSSPLVNTSGTVSCNVAGTSQAGCLSAANWNTFNGKQNALTIGNFTDAGTDGITVTNGTGAIIGTGTSIAQAAASASQNGYLTSSNWSTFNGKQNALSISNLTDAGTDGITVTGGTGSVIGSGTSISQHVADSTHSGYLNSTDWSTFNSKFALPSLTSGSVLFSNGTTISQDNSNFFYNSGTHKLGLSTTSPATTLDVEGTGITASTLFVNNVSSTPFSLQSTGTQGTAFTKGARIQSYVDSGSAMTTSNILGAVDFGGALSNAHSIDTTSAGIFGQASGSWSGTSAPSNLNFYTTPGSTTTPVVAAAIDSNGNFNEYFDMRVSGNLSSPNGNATIKLDNSAGINASVSGTSFLSYSPSTHSSSFGSGPGIFFSTGFPGQQAYMGDPFSAGLADYIGVDNNSGQIFMSGGNLSNPFFHAYVSNKQYFFGELDANDYIYLDNNNVQLILANQLFLNADAGLGTYSFGPSQAYGTYSLMSANNINNYVLNVPVSSNNYISSGNQYDFKINSALASNHVDVNDTDYSCTGNEQVINFWGVNSNHNLNLIDGSQLDDGTIITVVSDGGPYIKINIDGNGRSIGKNGAPPNWTLEYFPPTGAINVQVVSVTLMWNQALSYWMIIGSVNAG